MLFIIKFGKRLIRKAGRELITIFTKRIPNRIILIIESSGGSNTYSLLKNLPDNLVNSYDVITYYDSSETGKGIKHFFKKYRLISSAKLIITTHASYKPSRRHIHYQLWHGSLIKTSGVMEHKREGRKLKLPWKSVDYIMSYSETYTTFLNAQMLSVPWKYKVTGAPRNDFLFHSDGKSNLIKILNNSILEKKIIFHLPTWRGDADIESKNNSNSKSKSNIFGFSEFDAIKFDTFLEDHNCKLIFKPHPHEDDMAQAFIAENNLKNVLIINNADLFQNGFDLYEVLNVADILITDYSSVFNDFLLLDRPIIFASSDLDSYREGRGFVIESFEDWVPGPTAFDQSELQVEIEKSLVLDDYYCEKRKAQLNLQHRYKDGKSSERVWEFISTIMR